MGIPDRESVPFLCVEPASCYLNLMSPSSATIEEKLSRSSLTTFLRTSYEFVFFSFLPSVASFACQIFVDSCTKAALHVWFPSHFLCAYFMLLYPF